MNDDERRELNELVAGLARNEEEPAKPTRTPLEMKLAAFDLEQRIELARIRAKRPNEQSDAADTDQNQGANETKVEPEPDAKTVEQQTEKQREIADILRRKRKQ